MSSNAPGDELTITPPETYRNDSVYPFCPGCGHGGVVDALNRALVQLQLDPKRVVIVSDIGCSGLTDQYFETNAFHGLHGRSIAYASGIKLARPELEVIVVMGDGGCGIGGAHLLAAARRNVGISVLVFDNFNFGMTGGQHSVTTPTGSLTATTPSGNLERPLDICGTAQINGANFVYRGTLFEKDLSERIAEAIARPGFSLLDIWEPCTAYFAVTNRLSRKAIMKMLDELGFSTGVLHRDERPEYARAYRAAVPAQPPRPRTLTPRFEAALDRRLHLVLAGSAGGRVRSAARLGAVAGVISGLWAAQRDDYPVTVKTGHSLSELILSARPVDYTGIPRPDALVVVTAEGLSKVGQHLQSMTEADRLFTIPAFADVATRARKTVLDLGRLRSASHALALLAATLRELGPFPGEALEAAAREDAPAHAEANLEAIRAGVAALP